VTKTAKNTLGLILARVLRGNKVEEAWKKESLPKSILKQRENYAKNRGLLILEEAVYKWKRNIHEQYPEEDISLLVVHAFATCAAFMLYRKRSGRHPEGDASSVRRGGDHHHSGRAHY
jgi:hypothetical protein